MLGRLGRILRTIQYLKATQIIFQLKGRVSKAKSLKQYRKSARRSISPISLLQVPELKISADHNGTFTFLNRSKSFNGRIDWNYCEFGKLWNYNLQYVDFLNQKNLPEDVQVNWLRNLYSSLNSGLTKLEPYPASLRSINVIRFLSSRKDPINKFDDLIEALQAELTYLHDNYEYHLLGNHILENAFAMLMGSDFFNNATWRGKAESVLREQLEEQILEDGAHFELSPMYHQIILFRVFEAISYLPAASPVRHFLIEKASLMLGWLKEISFDKGDIPHFNDSTDGIAFTSPQLMAVGASMDILPKKISLGSSGYRKFRSHSYECVIDLQGISPDYQPGHNHADHLSFVLYVAGMPFMVDPGTSTYNISERRQWERSSMAHNTVTISNQNQSEVWGGFRVGRRAAVKIVNETNESVSAIAVYFHTNLKRKISHKREFLFNDMIVIKDSLDISNHAVARYFLHPDIKVSSHEGNSIICDDRILLKFSPNSEVTIDDYSFAVGFNILRPAKVIEVSFKKDCEISIRIK